MTGSKVSYLHHEIPELSVGFLDKEKIHVGAGGATDPARAMDIALATMKLARRLGITSAHDATGEGLPYAEQSDALLFTAPLTSALVNKKFAYLRGWRQFDSCVKGFNSLGLMAEHVVSELTRFRRLGMRRVNELKLEFLRSRQDREDRPVFGARDLEGLDASEFLEIDNFDLAVWRCFGRRTIVCSTSSNMGISTHQALRLMQSQQLGFRGKRFTLLDRTEGSLVIWCPDERADFMNAEKTALLRALEQDQPQITRLRTYINRQQRDPGALKDALVAGGFFFPTNPQSKEEMQQLLFVALNQLAQERNVDVEGVLEDPNVRVTLDTLNCETDAGKVIVHEGVEGGIHGLMVPYVILLDECIGRNLGKSVAVWNQASIGAALAGAVLADRILRDPDVLPDNVRGELNSLFPALSRFLDSYRLGRDLKTEIHGVFDVANLQSLAQLLGVVVEHHLSGRGTAYVGLGSSSYSNGNRCYEILAESIASRGAFRGKPAFHPATHTLNPFAQAVIFGEDLFRFLRQREVRAPIDAATLGDCQAHVRKPEPAGAAALAGYFLARFDTGTLSVVELACMLRLAGFSQETFLEFAGYAAAGRGARTFLQHAQDEGVRMATFARQMLLLLDWSLKDLERTAAVEKRKSKVGYWESPLDDATFEYLNGETCVYLTGDNTGQPSSALVKSLAESCLRHQDAIARFLTESAQVIPEQAATSPAATVTLLLYRLAKRVSAFGERFETMSRKWAHQALSRHSRG